MALGDFLVFLQGAGIMAAIGFVLSFAVDWFPQYEGLSAKAKRLAMLALCLAIPVLAKALELAFFGGVWGDFPLTWWPVLVAGFSAFTSSQVAHTRELTA
jgi:hypothetical protein